MSWMPAAEPKARPDPSKAVDLVIEARIRDLGGFSVRRVLPAAARRTVGPFIFFDHIGPATFAPGEGIDVRPHPHICLATVTYLFEGGLVHRDSLGNCMEIRPGELNWMTAGQGIVHSERTGPETRARGASIHGIQAWVALPKSAEENPPSFQHIGSDRIPRLVVGDATVTVVAGAAFGVRSPVQTASELFYVDAELDGGGALEVPIEPTERAVYVATGAVTIDGERFGPGAMPVLASGVRTVLHAEPGTRVLLLGGAPLDGPRHIFWNFVASTPERIERAKDDWRNGRFPKVPGDEVEFIALP